MMQSRRVDPIFWMGNEAQLADENSCVEPYEPIYRAF
jgi:hypothetical protein